MLAGANSAHTQRWANALSRRGLSVVLATQHPFDPADYDNKIRIRKLPFSGSAGYFLNAPALISLLKKEKPDVLHAHYLSGYGTTARLSGFHPSVVSVWGSDIFDFPKRSGWARSLVLSNLRSVDRILSTSMVMAREIESYHKPTCPIAITPFGVDTDLFIPRQEGVSGSSGTITIGLIKDLEWYSGADVLARAFRRALDMLRSSGREGLADSLRLSIAGDGSFRDSLESLVKDLGLTGSTRFLGFLSFPQVPAFFRTLDIYCAPSLAESFGVALLEAASCGLPVIASRVGGIPEVLEDGNTGILVEPGNPEALASALLALIENPETRARFGQAGRSFVMERYSWDSCVDRVLDIYEMLLGSWRR